METIDTSNYFSLPECKFGNIKGRVDHEAKRILFPFIMSELATRFASRNSGTVAETWVDKLEVKLYLAVIPLTQPSTAHLSQQEPPMTDIVTLIVVTREQTREIRLHEHQVAYWTKVWVDAGHTVTRK